MVSTPFYRTPAAAINHRKFMANVPFSYQPNMPECYKNGRGRNIVNYSDPLNRQLMNVTIRQMLEMVEQGHEFTLESKEDVYAIFKIIDFYILDATKQVEARSIPHILFCKKLVEFRDQNFAAFQMSVLGNDGIMNEILEIYDKDPDFTEIFSAKTTPQIGKDLPKPLRVRAVLQKLRRAPIDPALLDTSRIVPQEKISTSLDDFLPDEGPSLDEGFLQDLFGKKE